MSICGKFMQREQQVRLWSRCMPGMFLEQQRAQGVSGRVNGTALASEIIEGLGTLAFIFNDMDAIGGLWTKEWYDPNFSLFLIFY